MEIRAAGFLPAYGYFMSEWNPSDGPSRLWESGAGPRGAVPRRPRSRKRRLGVKKNAPLLHGHDVGQTEEACMGILKGIAQEGKSRKNRKYNKKFDSTRGYPGEGPARPSDRRIGRSRLRVIIKVKASWVERVPGRRTSASRRAARAGLRLRDGLLAPLTKKLYQEAFVRLWNWGGRRPPPSLFSNAAYDRFLAAFIEAQWSDGATRGDAGNALSASLCVYPSVPTIARSRTAAGELVPPQRAGAL